MENLVVIFLIALLTYLADKKKIVGLIVASYYGVYVALEFDFFGLVGDWIYSSHHEFAVWYLLYTAITFLFFVITLHFYKETQSKTILFYSIWLFFNLIISGVSAVFQSFETNAFLIVYNVVQNINLVIDLLVVVIGTDNPIRKSERVTNIVNYFSSRFDRYLLVNAPEYNKGKKCS